MHDLRAGVVRLTCVEDGAFLAGQPILGFRIGEGELVARKIMILVLARETAGLGKGIVGEGLARTGDMGHRPVEDLGALFVGVEALIDEVAQEAAGLRNPERHRVLDAGKRALGVMADIAPKKRVEIAGRHEGEARRHRVLCRIDEVVDRAGIHVGRTVDLDFRRADELEGKSFRRGRCVALLLAHRQLGACRVHGRRRIGERALAGRAGLVEDELFARDACNIGQLRQVEIEKICGKIRLPARPDNGVATIHQETVAGVCGL